MAVIDTLNINLQAVTAGLSKGLKSAQGMITSFAAKLDSPLAKLAGVFGGVFGANALKNFVTEGLDAADTLMDTANALQVNAEALNQLRHAAVVSDVSFEQLAGGIEKLNKNLGTSDAGARDMVDFLNTIGLLNTQWEHLLQLAPDQAFLRLAGAISKIEDPYLKAEAAVRLFGKSGQDLIPFLNQGEEGIKKLGAEVAGAFSPENQKKFDEADAAFKSLAESFLTMKQEVAIALAPTVVKITKEFEKWLKTLTEIVEMLSKSGMGEKDQSDQGGDPIGWWGARTRRWKAGKDQYKAAWDWAFSGLGTAESNDAAKRFQASQAVQNFLANPNTANMSAKEVDRIVRLLEKSVLQQEQLTTLQRRQLELLQRNGTLEGVEL